MITICEGEPTTPGVYVIYTDHAFTTKYAGRNLLQWDESDNKWYYPLSSQSFRGNVYGWIGPLPALELVEEEAVDVDDLL
jgi:hypothetical protein